jgi:protein-S-isoprenylcysteine O-methyltransferase Ste14
VRNDDTQALTIMFITIGSTIFLKRILVSRIIVAGFLLLILYTDSAHRQSIWSQVLFGTGIILIGIAAVGRVWCALYIGGYKNCDLVTAGPYSMTRNPLYFFSLLGFIGIGCATRTVTFALLFLLMFGFIYPSVIRREENFLHIKFGSAYDEYCKKTPRFFPAVRMPTEPEIYIVNPRNFRHALADVIWFFWMVAIIEWLDVFRELGMLRPLLRLP